jgi:hypothetical protein
MSTDALLFEKDSPASPSEMQSRQQVRFSNIGLGLLRIDKIEISGTGAGAFAMKDNTCQNITLHTGEFCTMQVGFTSQDSGTHHATLIIQDNASGSPRQVILKGIVKG